MSVLEVAEQTGEVGSTRRVPLGRRVVATLESAQSILNTDRIPDEDLRRTALREAEEEIGLEPDQVELVGALPPIGTYVTSYRVHPFVGLIPAGLDLRPNPAEVETVLNFELEQLRGAYAMRRLVRRGVPIRTPTFEIGRHLIWGATGRILRDLLERLPS